MSISNRLDREINKALGGNELYSDLEPEWKYFYESYLGGEDYREAGHLVRYQNETDKEYLARLHATPLENHCASVISVYNSFMFRQDPTRELGNMTSLPIMGDILEDADLDGRSFDQFMSDVNVWTSVFGHAWVIVAQPNVEAGTRAQQLEMGVRPYLNMLTPLSVIDWCFERDAVGRYKLSYFKYIEDINGDNVTVKEWYPDSIITQIYDSKSQYMGQPIVEENQLGVIPAVCIYNQRTGFRGVGKSDIADIADLQRFIYNATSEVDQSIRLNTHPSLVKTADTQAGIGAGSLINVSEDMDPALKPYLLEYNGASVTSIYEAIKHAISAIDKMANTGAVRATESKTISGVAMETEFQLLNSKLSSKARAMELGEENIWQFIAMYMDRKWDGAITYPNSFNIRDTSSEIAQLKTAKESATDPLLLREIDKQIANWLDLDNYVQEEVFEIHVMTDPVSGESRIVTTQAEHLELSSMGWIHQGE